MTRKVLSVGQCAADEWTIERLLQQHFGAAVTPADTRDDAVAQLRQGGVDLVLVNRIFDRNGASGIDFVADLKADAALAPIPVMLVSNHHDAQQRATTLGALPGFGKAQLDDPYTIERLRSVLGEAGKGA